MVGIVIAAVLLVILALVGIFACVRRGRRRNDENGDAKKDVVYSNPEGGNDYETPESVKLPEKTVV